MNTVTVYIDENLSTRERIKLKHDIMEMPYINDVELARNDSHDLMVEYEAHAGMPANVLNMLRSKGLHPDITSA